VQTLDETSPMKKENGNAKTSEHVEETTECFHQTVDHARRCNRSQFHGFIQTCKRNKPFSDGEFIKGCMSDVTSIICPEQKTKMDSIALSRRTVVRRVEKISDDLMSQVKDTSKQFLWYLLALI